MTGEAPSSRQASLFSAVTGSDLGLVVHGPEAPPGFTWDDRMGGHWYRRVPRSACSRLFRVMTSAWWRDFLVLVRSVDGPWAQVNYCPGDVPAPGPRDDPRGGGRAAEYPASCGGGSTKVRA